MRQVAPTAVSNVGSMMEEFNISLKDSRKVQKRELTLLRQNADGNRFSRLLANLYVTGKLALVKKKHLKSDSVGAEDQELLYLSLDHLVSVAQNYFRDSTITDKVVAKELRRNLLLVVDKSGRNTKKINKLRLLHIRKERLIEYQEAIKSEPHKDITALEERAIRELEESGIW